jgi:hypothetical protein
MAWTTPKTDWANNDLVAASNLNDIGNNLAALKAPPTALFVANESSDYTTTSTTFVNVDGTSGKFFLTITTTGGDVLVGFSGTVMSSGGSIFFDVEVDGARTAGDDGLMAASPASSSARTAVTFFKLIQGLAAGSHNFKLQWKENVGAGTATLLAGSGVANGDVHPQFFVREL